MDDVVAAIEETFPWFVLRSRRGEKFVECLGEFGDEDGIFDARADVAPAGGDAIAVVFVGDVKAADESKLVVADEEFAVVADGEAPEGKAIEALDGGAGGDEGIEIIFRESPGAEGVYEDADADVAFDCGEEGIYKLAAQAAVGIDVGLQPDGVAGVGNGVEHGGKDVPAATIPSEWTCHSANIVATGTIAR